jgi:biotin-dependent carboxylase-like uncharacterized protein
MIDVMRPGQCTTVQDRGRVGFRAICVPRSGALAALSARIANRFVGNPPNAALLEVYGTGPVLRFTRSMCIAICGVHVLTASQNRKIPINRPVWVEAGEVVDVGPPCGGMTSYLAVTGGIEAPRVLGSRSTDTSSGFGGIQGRPLRAGDVVTAVTEETTNTRIIDSRCWQRTSVTPMVQPSHRGLTRIRIIPGADQAVDPDVHRAFLESTFTVSPNSNRVALRFLESLPVTGSAMGTRLSEGTVHGTIQVLPAGDPLVLMPDGPVSGGYPVLGVVISVDSEVLAQTAPMSKIQFCPVSVTQAEHQIRTQARSYERRLMAIEYMLQGDARG